MKYLACCCFVFCVELFGQEAAQISGTVTDPAGALVPAVQITGTQAGATRTAVTDNLPLGAYRLEATMGFRTSVQTGLLLQVGANPTVPVTLTLGSVTDQVVVEANASLVETQNAGVGTTVVDSQRILDLPLNGQATDLIPLPGFAITTAAIRQTYAMSTSPSIAVAGGTAWSVQYNLDGAEECSSTLPAGQAVRPGAG